LRRAPGCIVQAHVREREDDAEDCATERQKTTHENRKRMRCSRKQCAPISTVPLSHTKCNASGAHSRTASQPTPVVSNACGRTQFLIPSTTCARGAAQRSAH
jgi:hypothetical protein